VIAAGATVGTGLYNTNNSQTAEIARQLQQIGALQRQINDQLEELHSAAPVQDASTAPTVPAQASSEVPPLLAPLKTVRVSALPAVAAMSQSASQSAPIAAGPSPLADGPSPFAADPSSRTEVPTGPYVPTSSSAAYPPSPPPPVASYAPYGGYDRSWTPHHPQPRRYHMAVLPPPVGYFISTVQRDVRALLR
jgi:hypothetical protein